MARSAAPPLRKRRPAVVYSRDDKLSPTLSTGHRLRDAPLRSLANQRGVPGFNWLVYHALPTTTMLPLKNKLRKLTKSKSTYTIQTKLSQRFLRNIALLGILNNGDEICYSFFMENS